MSQIIADIWPYLMTGLLGVIGWQWKDGHSTKIRVAVMERTIEDLQKTVDNIKQRQDSHSKKQDETLNLISAFKLEVVKQIAEVASDLKALTRSLEVYDDGVKIVKKHKGQ